MIIAVRMRETSERLSPRAVMGALYELSGKGEEGIVCTCGFLTPDEPACGNRKCGKCCKM